MDRGAWQAIVRGVARVRHDFTTKERERERERAEDFFLNSTIFYELQMYSIVIHSLQRLYCICSYCKILALIPVYSIAL